MSWKETMRELNVTDVPPKHETGRCDMMLACIGKALTDTRCSVKSEVRPPSDPSLLVACWHHQLAGQICCRRREQKRYCNTYKSVHWKFESKANRGSVHSNCIFGQYSVHVVVSKCHRNPYTDSARRQKNLRPPPAARKTKNNSGKRLIIN